MENENIKEKADDIEVYELSYLFLPSLSQEQVQSKVASIKGVLTLAGGLIISDEDPVLIDLSYQMIKVVGTNRHKVDTGYFGWVKFEIAKEGMEVIKKSLDANDEIIRYLIIKTVRENTLLNGKMMFRKEEKAKKVLNVDEVIGEETENVVPEIEKEIVEDDIDKSIDDLVIA